MSRRVHVSQIRTGQVELDPAQARHARDVLRLIVGTVVEVFDDAGNIAAGELVSVTPREVVVRIDSITEPASSRDAFAFTIAAAVPKGERADWMVEKLSELGTAEFIPLAAERSVVLPEGKNKRERWARIATESAKQSRRIGVMRIGELTSVQDLLKALANDDTRAAWYFSTASDAQNVSEIASKLPRTLHSLVALIGPEGGWTDAELSAFAGAQITPVHLTETILRIETAAIAAGAVIGSIVALEFK